MKEPLTQEKQLTLRRMLTAFGFVFVVSLLLSLIFSGSGAGTLRDIFLSRFGIFENVTVVFYLAAAVIALWRGHQVWRVTRAASAPLAGAALLSVVLMLEELNFGAGANADTDADADASGGGVFGTLETWLFAPLPEDISIEGVAFLGFVRLMALACVFWGICALWYFRRYLKPVVAKARNNMAVPFWLLFALLIIVSVLMHFGALPMRGRFEEAIEMNAALAWLMAVCTMPVLPREKVN